ncbi:xylose isomerase-likeTIM barrel domain-containing protein [Octadecabacter antarcticus 307]|uniref:Xylose isomerase-likeTIM barrel domain-containing protein n=1 Tax=Octadecabacter antarcticus 307 TaxID=391626 RepID=M9RA17_9RHOB|nr:TIM barrel protein [Octadecabacter antarcticus]AGI68658.1 xylose isomerase-likeTIM barrel domain-containing protein [Octadecabacter antarcticus 307]
MTHDKNDYLLWQGTMRELSLKEQLHVAQQTGFGKISITPLHVTKWKEAGLSAKDQLSMADDHGVKLAHLDPLTRWAPKWLPDNVDPGFNDFLGFSIDDFMRLAEEFQVESMSTISSAPAGTVNSAQYTESFAAICERAASIGVRCDLEFIPFWGLFDLNMAWTIVRDADKDNSGIVFDYWHFMRGTPDLDLLSRIPGEKISSVQLADASLAYPADRPAPMDCLDWRVPCGEGEFPVTEITQTIQKIGGMKNVGPEIFSAKFDKMSADEIIASIRYFFPKALEKAGALNGYTARPV